MRQDEGVEAVDAMAVGEERIPKEQEKEREDLNRMQLKQK